MALPLYCTQRQHCGSLDRGLLNAASRCLSAHATTLFDTTAVRGKHEAVQQRAGVVLSTPARADRLVAHQVVHDLWHRVSDAMLKS